MCEIVVCLLELEKKLRKIKWEETDAVTPLLSVSFAVIMECVKYTKEKRKSGSNDNNNSNITSKRG